MADNFLLHVVVRRRLHLGDFAFGNRRAARQIRVGGRRRIKQPHKGSLQLRIAENGDFLQNAFLIAFVGKKVHC